MKTITGLLLMVVFCLCWHGLTDFSPAVDFVVEVAGCFLIAVGTLLWILFYYPKE